MDNLTKENFWDDLMLKYPNAMKIFCAWVDEYKKKVNWNRLIKFHHLPIAFQLGVFIEFTRERDMILFTPPHHMANIPKAIQDWFQFTEDSIILNQGYVKV